MRRYHMGCRRFGTAAAFFFRYYAAAAGARRARGTACDYRRYAQRSDAMP